MAERSNTSGPPSRDEIERAFNFVTAPRGNWSLPITLTPIRRHPLPDSLYFSDASGELLQSLDFHVVDLAEPLAFEAAPETDVDNLEILTHDRGILRFPMWPDGATLRALAPVELDREAWRFTRHGRPHFEASPSWSHDFLPEGLAVSPRFVQLGRRLLVGNRSRQKREISLKSTGDWVKVDSKALLLAPDERALITVQAFPEQLGDGSHECHLEMSSKDFTARLPVAMEVRRTGIIAALKSHSAASSTTEPGTITLDLIFEARGTGTLECEVWDAVHRQRYPFLLEGSYSEPSEVRSRVEIKTEWTERIPGNIWRLRLARHLRGITAVDWFEVNLQNELVITPRVAVLFSDLVREVTLRVAEPSLTDVKLRIESRIPLGYHVRVVGSGSAVEIAWDRDVAPEPTVFPLELLDIGSGRRAVIPVFAQLSSGKTWS